MAPISYLETDVLYCDDNLRRLSQFPSDCIDLIYLDPPFFSNRHYEVIWGDEAEVRSFEDRWAGGLNVYTNWMQERVVEMHRILKPTGSLYLHCDWHAAHHLRVMLDSIFGTKQFQNEFIWYYSGGGASKKRWARKHDNILFYTKGKDWTFNADAVRTPYKWTAGQKRADQSDRDLSKGKLADDVWEHHGVMPWAKEWLGYPTQKPEALLERLLLASTNRDDIVLDPFCGCGTSVAVAEKLHRKWVGIDISPTAVRIMQARVEKLRTSPITVVGMPVGEDELRALPVARPALRERRGGGRARPRGDRPARQEGRRNDSASRPETPTGVTIRPWLTRRRSGTRSANSSPRTRTRPSSRGSRKRGY